MTISHDHLITCRKCNMPILDIRDCECPGDPVSYETCGYCKEEEYFNEIERKRNVDY